MMKKFLIALMILLATTTCHAKSDDDLDAAQVRLVCAICSMGAYSDAESNFLRSTLMARGWQIETLSQKTSRADAKAYLVSKGDVKILTIAGTESLRDVEVDFRFGRVHLHDDTTLDAYDKKTADKFFVHRGFRDYADVVLSNGLAERLKNSLNENPNETLYLTGHSLGGAVAIVAGIRLIDSGVDNSRLKVITFGSPAVGSHKLAKNYEDKLDLTRVVMRGDVMKKTLRVLGYVQFGATVEYRQHVSDDHTPHKMAVYLDCAIRDFCAAGGTFQHEAQNKIDEPIYAAPIFLLKDSFHKDDEKIILNALNDILANHFSNLTFADKLSVALEEDGILDADFDEFVDAANAQGCKYVLIRILRAKKIRDDMQGDIKVTIEEIILDANGLPISMHTTGSSTAELTIFEAALSAQEALNENRHIP